MPLKPVILRGAEGEVADSILTESHLSLDMWGDRPQIPISLYERNIYSISKIPLPLGEG